MKKNQWEQTGKRGGAVRTANPPKSKKALVRNVLVLFFSVIFLIGGGVCLYANFILGRVGYAQEKPQGPGLFQSTTADEVPSVEAKGSQPAPTGELKLVNGLYHDDSIVNILLLGADDYQENDVGRTDSMLLVSVDTRHNKLKITSFLRDTLVPGSTLGVSGVDRLNTAYTYAGGNEKGAAATTRAIEANYGVDIDRWVLIKDATFDKIIEVLGGVEITLTEGEANEINKHFGYTGNQRVKAGTQLLNPQNTHYYSRIRHIGSDFGRTERQRNVMTSIINQFKKANLGEINTILIQVLPLVKTNLTADEIVMLASNALTYLNYKQEQAYFPGDDEYEAEDRVLYSSGNIAQNVLVLSDWSKAKTRLVEFIYEKTLK